MSALDVVIGIDGGGEDFGVAVLVRGHAMHETFALDQLRRAALARGRLERLTRGTVDYGAEAYVRQLALQAARFHIAKLRALDGSLSPELLAAIAASGLGS